MTRTILPGCTTRQASTPSTASSRRSEGDDRCWRDRSADRRNLGRRWFGYGPYKPVRVGKLLDIFRVFYNFVEVGRDKQTPAMRLGLAKGKRTVENIIYDQ